MSSELRLPHIETVLLAELEVRLESLSRLTIDFIVLLVKLVQDFLSEQVGVPIEFRLRIIPSTEVTAIDVTTPVDAQTSSDPEQETHNAPDISH